MMPTSVPASISPYSTADELDAQAWQAEHADEIADEASLHETIDEHDHVVDPETLQDWADQRTGRAADLAFLAEFERDDEDDPTAHMSDLDAAAYDERRRRDAMEQMMEERYGHS
jgi:hypothetical protein